MPVLPFHVHSPRRCRRIGTIVILACALISGCSDDATEAANHLKAARGFIAENNARAAIIELKSALQLTPENADARTALGRIYLQAGRGPDAVKELDRATRLGHKDPQLAQDLVRALLLSGEFDKALEMARTQGDGSAPWLVLQARGEFAHGRVPESQALFEQALSADQNNIEALRGLAALHMQRREFEPAHERLSAALAVSKEDVATWLLMGELQLATAKAPEAETSYRNALELAKGLPSGHLGMARALLGQRKTQAAREHLAALEQLAPNDPLTHYLKAVESRQNNDLDGTVSALRETLRIIPNHAPSLLLMGQTQFLLRNLAQAGDSLLRYLNQRPNDAAARRLLAAVQGDLGQLDAAQATLQPVLEANPQDAQALSLLGTLKMRTGDKAGGQELLGQAVDQSPKTPAIRTQLAASHLAAGELQKAADELESVIAQAPDYARADVLLVLTRLRAGDHDAAFDAVNRLQAKLPRSAVALNLLGAVHESRGDIDAARESYLKAFEVDPGASPPLLNLARIDLSRGDTASAKRRFEEVLKRHDKDIGALMGLAKLASDAGDSEGSLELLERARAASSRAIRPRLVLGHYYLRTGRNAEALLIADEAAKVSPSAPAVLLLQGRAQLASLKVDQAIGTLTSLVKAAPESDAAHFQLGLAQRAAGQLDAARESLQKALQLSPQHHTARAMLGRIELAARKFERVREIISELENALPQAAAAPLLEGDMLMAQQQPAEAAKAYQLAHQRAGSNTTLLRAVRATASAGDVSGALSQMRGWLDANATDHSVRNVYAAMLQQSGDLDTAAIEYAKLIEVQPSNVVALNNLAWIHYQKGNDRALDYARQAHDLVPNRPEIADTYGWLLVESGRVEEGLKLLREAATAVPEHGEIAVHYAAALIRAGDSVQAKQVLERILALGKPFSSRGDAEEMLNKLKN